MTEELVTLISLSNPIDAEMVKGMLEAAGIEVFLHDLAMSSLGLWTAIDGIKVKVRQSDLELARQVLQDVISEDGTASENQD